MLKFEYGVYSDADPERRIIGYWRADAIPNNDWSKVLSVRIGMVVRGDERDSFTDTQSYLLPGNYTYTPAVADRRFQRFLVTREVHIRNRNLAR
jgi:hypothetical protein